MAFNPNCRAAAAVLIRQQDDLGNIKFLRILNAKRKVWECPGGKIEPGETPSQAIIRETNEETNLRLNPKKLRLERVYANPTEDGQTFIMFFFSYNISDESHQLEYFKLSEEHLDASWETLSTLLNLPTEKVAPRFLDYIRSHFYVNRSEPPIDVTLKSWYQGESPTAGFPKGDKK